MRRQYPPPTPAQTAHPYPQRPQTPTPPTPPPPKEPRQPHFKGIWLRTGAAENQIWLSTHLQVEPGNAWVAACGHHDQANLHGLLRAVRASTVGDRVPVLPVLHNPAGQPGYRDVRSVSQHVDVAGQHKVHLEANNAKRSAAAAATLQREECHSLCGQLSCVAGDAALSKVFCDLGAALLIKPAHTQQRGTDCKNRCAPKPLCSAAVSGSPSTQHWHHPLRAWPTSTQCVTTQCVKE